MVVVGDPLVLVVIIRGIVADVKLKLRLTLLVAIVDMVRLPVFNEVLEIGDTVVEIAAALFTIITSR
jgi:hypothetical protein